jgi:hypothetical protein
MALRRARLLLAVPGMVVLDMVPLLLWWGRAPTARG